MDFEQPGFGQMGDRTATSVGAQDGIATMLGHSKSQPKNAVPAYRARNRF
jgi:hypothetical protein